MLYAPGPIDLIPDAALPTPGPRRVIEAAVTAIVRALDGAAGAIASQQSAIAGSGDPSFPASDAFDLADAAAEHERQSRDSDPALSGVAAASASLENEIAGLLLELEQDLHVDVPEEPRIPPGVEDPGGRDRGLSGWDSIVNAQFVQLAGRDAMQRELVYARRFEPDVLALRDWILGGAVIPPSEAPPPSPPPSPEGAELIAIYRGHLATWIRENFRREPDENELTDVDRIYEIHGTITDDLYNQMLANQYIPRL